MHLLFHIEYFAPSEESLHIVFNTGHKLQMTRCAYGQWFVESDAEQGATYHYELHDLSDAVIRREPLCHTVECSVDAEIFDCWQDNPAEQPLYSSFFTKCVFRREAAAALKGSLSGVQLAVAAPTLMPDEVLAVVGESEELGGWNVKRAVVMNDSKYPIWQVTLPHEVLSSEYKFVVLDSSTHSLKRYEGGENRRFPAASHNKVVVQGLRLRDEMSWRGAGVAIPVFSLRSKNSWGCGDFADLRLMADWAAATGMSVIQLLPVNDTTTDGSRRDSYPYNAISAFALNPLYLSSDDALTCCVKCSDGVVVETIKGIKSKFARRGKRLNDKDAVDYEATIKLKNEYLHELYAVCGKSVIESESFERFFDDSKSWLMPYMAFCVLRDKYSTVNFASWPEYSTYDAKQVESFIAENHSECYFYAFVQYLLDEQLCHARDYAHQRGVALKGDIPIGVAPRSVDVWCAPELYNCTMSAGAPPDAFAEDGQNWGFPTYNWSRMAEDGYAWWCARLKKMERYFDAYRIDHILGFFRIWEVPRNAVSAVLGHFNPSLPYTEQEIVAFGFEFDAERDVAQDLTSTNVLFLEYPYSQGGFFPRIEGFRTAKFAALTEEQQRAYMRLYEDFYYYRHNDMWRDNALKRLRALMQASPMLTCGEDLGMIPACVAEVMASERILSLEIERMPKQFGVEFGATEQYPYLSVAATSTHDMSTIRGWWEEDSAVANRYWTNVLNRDGEAEAVCSAKTAYDILLRHMQSRSMLAILPLQDWLAVDESLRIANPAAERINIPADANHYWRYRMHLTLEELLSAEEFNAVIADLVTQRKA